MALAADRLAALSKSQRRELEALLLDFDQSWESKALADQAVGLMSGDEHFRRVALLELVKIDLERQWRSGNRRRIEDYLERFPELGTQETVDPELLQAEHEVRRQVGVSAPLRDFQLRFPQRFNQLRQLLEQGGTSVSAPAASVDTSQSGKVSETRVEGVSELSSLPPELGRYRILKRLGEGGMGSVYLAHDTELDRKVAIKVPKFEGNEDKQLVERFYREARAAANLRHANICPVYDVGDIKGTRYICMAHIEGRALSAYIRRDGNQPQRQVALVVRKLAIALQEAHKHGIVHRDLKPANIMIDQNREPVIMDFGLARQLDKHQDSRLTQEGTVMGSPAYMSPEQVAGDVDRIGPSTDIYSLGVILFELLTDRAPFEGPITAVLGQIMTQEPPRPSEFRQDVEPRLEQICLKMMAKRIDDRYGSMQEVADALTVYIKVPKGKVSTPDAARPLAVDRQKEEQDAAALFAPRLTAPERITVAERVARRTTPALVASVQRLPPKVIWIAGGLASAFGLVLLGVLFVIRTPHGTLTIDIDDANLTVSIDGNEYTFGHQSDSRQLLVGEHQFAVKLGEQTIPLGDTVRLSSGEYQGQHKLAVKLDGAELTSDRFRIVRGDARVLSVELSRHPEPPPKDADAILVGDTSQSGAAPAAPAGAGATALSPKLAVAPFSEVQARQHQQDWAEFLSVPVAVTNSMGMQLRLIPPGEFMMGSAVEDIPKIMEEVHSKPTKYVVEHIRSESPQHMVKISQPFYVAAHELTVERFKVFVDATGYKTEAETNGQGGMALVRASDKARWFQKPEFNWRNPGFTQSDQQPIVNISWSDAAAFCQWLSKQEDRSYALPTEAQWEYSCRAGSQSLWFFGDDESKLDHYAWHGSKGGQLTKTVGKKLPNAFGLFDVHGNAWEWCSDLYGETYYGNSPVEDPSGPPSGDHRVLRGGSFHSSSPYTRSAYRSSMPPDRVTSQYGFRVVVACP